MQEEGTSPSKEPISYLCMYNVKQVIHSKDIMT